MSEIDNLTVGIGLNSEEFQAGIDRVMQGIEGLRTSTEDAAEGMGASFAAMSDSVLGLGLKFAGLFFAIRGIEDVVGYFKNLSDELAQLGFAGEYLGQSSVQLSRWGEVARLAGGHAQDAIAAVQGLQSSIFGLEYQGQMSQNLLMLNRLRVAYLDPQGHMLPIETIAMNAAKALQEQLPGKGNEAMRVQWAAQIFGPGGIANAVGGGVEALRKFYAESAKDQKNITQKVIDSQKHLQQSLTSLSYDIKNDAAKQLEKLTPTIQELIKVIRNDLVPAIDEIVSDLLEWLHPGKAALNWFDSKSQGPIDWWSPMSVYEHFGSWLGRMAADVHEDWENAMKSGRKSILSGVVVPAQVSARLPAMTPIQTEALKLLHLEAGGLQGDPNWSKAITIYNTMTPQEAAYYVGAALSTGNLPQAQRTAVSVMGRPIATPLAGRPSLSHTHNTNVNIGSLNVHAPNARDARGIMETSMSAWKIRAHDAMERRLLAAQADPGLQ